MMITIYLTKNVHCETETDQEDYTLYRRRIPSEGGGTWEQVIRRHDVFLDNTNVAPFVKGVRCSHQCLISPVCEDN